MQIKKPLFFLALISLSAFSLSACGSKTTTQPESSENQEELTDDITPYTDKFATAKVEISKTYKMNQEFPVTYKTYDPEGAGEATFKAKSLKPVDKVGDVSADEGKKLYLLEIAVKGNSKNKGTPSTFNQVGDTPSPQFVMVNKSKSISYVEETYFSDSYTNANKLFELSKITLDSGDWVNTAIVFQVDKSENPELALRFTNPQGKIEFYGIEK